MARTDSSPRGSERALTPDERRMLALLALPALGFALAITVVTTYLPVVAVGFLDSTTAIGLLIGAEGLLALVLPIAVGSRSDRLESRLGGRLPFTLAATPVLALALVLLGFVGSFVAALVVLLLFFAAYYVGYPPYRALYPDLIEAEIAGRSQSAQAVARGGGTAAALLGGGLLLAITQPVPFIFAAAIALAAVGAFAHVLLTRRGVPEQERRRARGTRQTLRDVREVVGQHGDIRLFMGANALWETTLGAVKTFVVLYITVGLGISLSGASGIIGGAALFVLAGAATSGKLADRFGHVRVMRIAALVYGGLLVIPFATQATALLIPATIVISFGGGVLMTLPFALLMPMMPAEEHGLVTGLYSLSRGVGTMLGPLLGGVAVDMLTGVFSDTQGYAAVWGVAAAATLASLPLLNRMRARS